MKTEEDLDGSKVRRIEICLGTTTNKPATLVPSGEATPKNQNQESRSKQNGIKSLLNCIPQKKSTVHILDHTPRGAASAYALYNVSKKASATCPTIVGPTGLD